MTSFDFSLSQVRSIEWQGASLCSLLVSTAPKQRPTCYYVAVKDLNGLWPYMTQALSVLKKQQVSSRAMLSTCCAWSELTMGEDRPVIFGMDSVFIASWEEILRSYTGFIFNYTLDNQRESRSFTPPAVFANFPLFNDLLEDFERAGYSPSQCAKLLSFLCKPDVHHALLQSSQDKAHPYWDALQMAQDATLPAETLARTLSLARAAVFTVEALGHTPAVAL